MTGILITGMSGTGKSTVVDELADRGFRAIDTDSEVWSEWQTDETGQQDWVWRAGRIRDLLIDASAGHVVLAGCKSNQGQFYPLLDHVVLLTAPLDVILERVENRDTNTYGKTVFGRHLIRHHYATVEPLLRRSSDIVLDTSILSVDEVSERIIALLDSGDAVRPQRSNVP